MRALGAGAARSSTLPKLGAQKILAWLDEKLACFDSCRPAAVRVFLALADESAARSPSLAGGASVVYLPVLE